MMHIQDDVLAVLDAAESDGCALALTGQLERKLYERTNKVLVALGGKWDKRAKAHLFPTPVAERIEAVLLTGEVVLPADFGRFYTPPDLAQYVVDLVGVEGTHRALEPSAGQGALAMLMAQRAQSVHCVEIGAENTQVLRDGGLTVTHADFLTLRARPRYHRIIMNPPFSKQADIKHVTHAIGFLTGGGHMAAIMSASVNFRTDRATTAFRAMLDGPLVGSYRIKSLPQGSFKSSGTMVNTVLLLLEAKQ